MREFAERAYFVTCLAFGRFLRAGRYSKVQIVNHNGAFQVRKSRRFYAPFLVWLGGPLVTILDTGVRVLPQRDWEERERMIYTNLHGVSIRIDSGGTIVLPCLPGKTLATLLEDPALDDSVRKKSIELAVIALVEFHRAAFTHGDAMAENVLVDLEGGVAQWFDFETVHEPARSIAWRRADDVRALLTTCLLRTAPEQFSETLDLILAVYADQEVTRQIAASFTSDWRRPLAFHLGQAPLSYRGFGEIARLLREGRR